LGREGTQKEERGMGEGKRYTVKKSYLFLEGRCKFPAPSLQKFVGDTGKFFPFPKALFLCFQRGKPFHSGERAFFHV
jgi:hypothetical protein